ncbi:aspartyl-tRNA synthetase [Mesoplasma florum L1]|uniref:Aspartate--tRNA ligase n=1 Tax=Mesoplasma florum (strain ATCC 33453 / NBRC 100688 / NCTC 11704 / L1) TaxID=265311 RepID=SYD_MESFL|nr:aspartate--tRNA ligase [Mesoplasma florum]Q6F1A0.1 RecName: Full=Aspartate--tRNA ligase; AltName: Full=Aspartyl-tRNA synthetase; Short=AspRS [Mesoplasma florum L1]AAT75723.1 aspartyl-tRNA synthetase [Mesoplasma florum L1]ATI73328.1 aspartate--tRNA ligase [Mesoplasma florum]AVN61729.1 aspartate--tRNA ligase [Mesoplasma florum]
MKRTHNCNQLNISNVNQEVTLKGWIKKIRKMGQITFIDLRDFYGITQIVVGENKQELINNLKPEYVISITGKVIERKSKNADIPTGEIEIEVKNIELINKSELTPFVIENDVEVSEETRMSYRYLDLRRQKIQNNMLLRAKVNSIIRKEFEADNFVEVETPYFGKSTPEGARDFLVPSRLNKNTFYALPQSPQLYKQLLMVSGFDKYYQIVRCFRDEDLRNDRQPEFTQLDMEMSFASATEVQDQIEKVIKKIFLEVKGIDFKEKLIKMPFREAIDLYGSDKPDIRFDLKINTLNEIFDKTQIKLFESFKENKLSIRGICVEELLSKKQLEILTETAKQKSFNNLAFAKFENGTWSGSIASSLSDGEKQALIKQFNIKDKATILLNVGKYEKISDMLGAVRNKVAEILNLADPNDYKLLWIIDFPLYEWSDEESRYVAAHNPFTMPNIKSIDDFETNKEDAIADSYDLVLNGFELGSGGVRITDSGIQQRMFEAVGLDDETIEKNFGWFINAYKYGAPNHAGFAFGIDRVIMLLTHSESIRDVIAFPKNSKGIDMMNDAPSYVEDNQLSELSIKTIK